MVDEKRLDFHTEFRPELRSSRGTPLAASGRCQCLAEAVDQVPVYGWLLLRSGLLLLVAHGPNWGPFPVPHRLFLFVFYARFACRCFAAAQSSRLRLLISEPSLFRFFPVATLHAPTLASKIAPKEGLVPRALPPVFVHHGRPSPAAEQGPCRPTVPATFPRSFWGRAWRGRRTEA